MGQRLADSAILGIVSLLYSGAVRLLRLRKQIRTSPA
jgi:hypothetical protein